MERQKVAYYDSDISRLLKAFALQKADRVPYLEYWVTNQEVFEYVLGGTLDYEVAFTYGKTHEYPGTLVPEDIVEFAHRIGMDAVGCPFTYAPNGVYEYASDGSRHYVDGQIKSWDDLKYLDPPPDLSEQLENLEKSLEAVRGKEIGVYPIFTTFFDRTYQAIGYQDFMYMVYGNRKLIEHLMDRILEVQLRAMEKVVQYDEIAFVLVADDIAFKSGLMIKPEMFKELFIPRMKKLIEPALKRNKIVTFHTDGDMREVIPILIDLGISAIHPNEPAANDIYELKRLFGNEICLCGNIDTFLLSRGTKEEVKKDVRDHIEKLAPDGGYVLGSSTSILEGIPPENFLAMIDAVHKYGAYDR